MDTDGAPEVTELRVDVLGPLRLHVDGRLVDVPGRRRRAVLALLALASGHVVTVDALIDALWPDDPPDSGSQALHSHISRLRRNLGPAAHRLRRHGAGYLLRLADDELDVTAARRLAAQVTAQLRSDPRQAADTARAALALWRGQALQEFTQVAPLIAEAVGLAELHRQLRDDALQARLADGDPGVTADAASAAGAEPLRERGTTLLMRALAAEGRTAEAMAVAAAYRRELAEQTGLDPGPALSALEHQIAAGALAPPPTAASAARTIARPSGPMVGRDRDSAELHRLLESHATITVTGPGGVGKTRLALDVAADLGQRAGAQSVLVALAAVTDPARVPEAVASTLGLRITPDASPAGVADALAAHRLLLVLDNCEHVAAACRELITALQTRAPGVRILATSRVTLHVPGEFVVRLQPLPLPRDTTDLQALSRQPSVLAFLEHGRRRSPDFTLTTDDAGPLVEVIRRLDGLPLAIELAAGQLAVLSVTALRDRLGRALDVLGADRPEEDARQRTLRATIRWSYCLLTSPEQALLRALAPFPGGADLATVEMLAADTVHGTDPLVVLARLVDASLVVTDVQRTGRYSLLETVRDFLLHDIDLRGERASAERRFLSWARRSALDIGAQLFSADEAAADRRLRAELANLRAARDLARLRGDEDLRVDITLAFDEAAIWRDIQELWSWCLELADDPRLAGHPRQVALLGGAAEAAWLQGELDRSVELARSGIDIATRDEQDGGGLDGDGRHRCWSALAAVALFRTDFAAARAAWLQGATTDPLPAGHLAGAALAAVYAGDRGDAVDLLVRARAANVAGPCTSHRAFIDYVAGEAAADNDTDAAILAYTAAVEQARRCGARFVEGVAMLGLASVWTATGNVAAAADGFRFLLDYWLSTGNRTQLWTTARNAAWLLLEHGRNRVAAILLTAADAADAAAAVDAGAAARAARAYATLDDLLGSGMLAAIRRDARNAGAERVVELARQELGELADLDPDRTAVSPDDPARPGRAG